MPTMECTMVKHNGKFFGVALDRHWRTRSRQPPNCPLSGLRELPAIGLVWRKAVTPCWRKKHQQISRSGG